MKKLVALVLAAVMLMSMASFAAAEEPVKLTALACTHSLTRDVSEMLWIQEIAAEAGVEIGTEKTIAHSATTIINVLFAPFQRRLQNPCCRNAALLQRQ